MSNVETSEPLVQHGCAIYTVDNWRDGHNYGGKRIATTADESNDEMPTQEMEENAAFIVRACNSHYELLEACKSAYEGLIRSGACHTLPLDTALLKQAIAKATGGQP